MKHIFISYAHEDEEFAHQLSLRLRESGRVSWQDIKNLRGGDHWQSTIDNALRGAEALVVVMSPAATKSQYVTYEWAYALGAGVLVIPVIRKRTNLHPRLSSLHYIDFTTRRGTPWVNLRKALPARSLTILIRPEIHAKFNIVGGKPERDGAYYVINIYIHKAPRAIKQVTYEFHDETLKREKWLVKAAPSFESSILTNGDSLITAAIPTSSKKSLRLASSLYDALRLGHGSRPGPRIKSALREIRASRTS